jgi:hypothetical protein
VRLGRNSHFWKFYERWTDRIGPSQGEAEHIENAETPNESPITPVSSPELRDHTSYDFDESYVELDDEFIKEYINCDSS